MKLGKFEITAYVSVTDSSVYSWRYLIPVIEYRNKHKGLWEFAFSWWWRKGIVVEVIKNSW